MQKKLPLYKQMVCVTPDGYIPFVFGPYKAKQNDATIMHDCFEKHSNELSILQNDDVFIADRGFRDVIDFLVNTHHLRAFTPALKTDGKQLDTYQANLTRCVTKVRWIVELTFGKMKTKYSILLLNRTIEHDPDRFMIAIALMNMFHKPIIADGEFSVEIANEMKSKLHYPNLVQGMLNQTNILKSSKCFFRLEDTEHQIMKYFPSLTTNDLHHIGCGTYQIHNCISYYSEHVANHEGVFKVSKYDPNESINFKNYGFNVKIPILVKVKMHSRFHGSANHDLLVLADKALNGSKSIAGYYCTCQAGAKTVGTCSHIMTVIWYLGYACKHPDLLITPKEKMAMITE